jgi:hypothetical protein
MVYLLGLGFGLIKKVQALLAKRHANSAMGLAPAPDVLAWSLEAVPSSTRLAMPCKMAAMRNML